MSNIQSLSLQVLPEGNKETRGSELQNKLKEAQNEAVATKEELNSCRESLEKLQELLQVQSPLDIKIYAMIFVLSAVFCEFVCRNLQEKQPRLPFHISF